MSTLTTVESAFISVVVEQWKLIRSMARLVNRLPAESRERVDGQVRYADERLSSLLREVGYSLETFEGQAFEPNLPVACLNVGDIGQHVGRRIVRTIEPAVVRSGTVLRFGQVEVSEG